jgi:carboxymethylenebutenolidase
MTTASGHTEATPVLAQQAIKTDTLGLVAGDVTIAAGDSQMPVYRAMPDGMGPFPIILVIEEIFGVHEYIKDICRRLAKLGYCALAPELYARLGDIGAVSDIPTLFRDFISRTPDAQMLADIDAALAWAVSQSKGDAARIGITGFCRGGRATLLYAAHSPAVKAGVAWYGKFTNPRTEIQPLMAADVAGDLNCPVLGLYGGKDDGIPVAEAHQFEADARAAGKNVEMVIYPEAGHAFHADYRPGYDPVAAEDGWQRMLAWFARCGVA